MTAPTTLAQKLVAHAAGRETYAGRDRHLQGRPRDGARLERPPATQAAARASSAPKIWDPDKVVVIIGPLRARRRRRGSAAIIQIARDWVKEAGVDAFYDAQGICHVVAARARTSEPGMFAVGGDAFADRRRLWRVHVRHRRDRDARRGGHRRDLAQGAADIVMHLDGALVRGRLAKDMMLFLIGRSRHGRRPYQAVEYRGDAIRRCR